MRTNLTQILDILEKKYGSQKLAGPKDPYEMVVFLNCGYPASDAKCAKGFQALKREVGVPPEQVLAATKAKLARVITPQTTKLQGAFSTRDCRKLSRRGRALTCC